MPKTEQELLARDADRDIGAELLEAIREMKSEKAGAIHSPVALARYRVKMSQSEFARLLGVSVRTLQEWEQGRREPSGAARSLIRVAQERPEVLRELFLDQVA
ncbi:helix-turn-helix domain-containing protein [Thiococcus pfennigii]|jgi:putative transcriptional regulator|uniref:helix-turn-helix domain-containing protein n=1 Tax=Thiococcus pfennigii TaxID=1057 RepID=UPI001908DA13|nr:helix-turn-helix domain-containing protein [Thiococcus pfennigii]MBK1702741.1 transcriptional regulator [Thiococcus pfennigii]MBK1733510.1 transcriptional regulator [Thiococcus pfennigii]